MSENNFFDLVKILRQETLASFKKCQEALVASEGDLEKAKKFLQESNSIVADKKASNQTEYGVCAIQINQNQNQAIAVLITLCCETSSSAQSFVMAELVNDIVNKILTLKMNNKIDNKDLTEILETKIDDKTTIQGLINETVGKIGENIKLQRVEIVQAPHISYYVHNKSKDANGKVMSNVGTIIAMVGFENLNEGKIDISEPTRDIAMHLAGYHFKPEFIRVAEISDEVIEEYKTSIFSQISQQFSGKPQKVIDNILSGRMNNLLAEKVFELQPFIKDESHTIESFAKKHGLKVDLFRIINAKR